VDGFCLVGLVWLQAQSQTRLRLGKWLVLADKRVPLVTAAVHRVFLWPDICAILHIFVYSLRACNSILGFADFGRSGCPRVYVGYNRCKWFCAVFVSISTDMRTVNRACAWQQPCSVCSAVLLRPWSLVWRVMRNIFHRVIMR